MWYAFQVYDKDGNGKISIQELKAVMKEESIAKAREAVAGYGAYPAMDDTLMEIR